MNVKGRHFLSRILGVDGSEAMARAVDRHEPLESVLLPRAILSWIKAVGPFGHDGSIPGVADSHLKFSKNEEGFAGSVNIYDFVYEFEKASVFHLASSLALALDVDPTGIGIKDLDIERLGKSIDMLVKATIVKEELAKVKAPEQAGGAASPIQPIQAVAPAPVAPATPKMAEAPKMAKPKVKLPIPSKIKVTKSEMSYKCGLCGRGSFLDSTYVGCSCLAELAKSVHSDTVTNELTLGDDWDKDSIMVLLECIGRI